MDLSYDREQTARAYDEYGEQEWGRHERAPFHRVAFHLHRHYLTKFIRIGDRVLEAGAASGRFTVELARLGATVVVTDISPGQLELNVTNIAEAGLESAVESRALADIVDLSAYADGEFDAVVCYGGPLSHVMDRADQALGELLRVTKPGGHVLLGVMSLHGSLHAFLAGADAEIEEFGIDEMQAIFESGDLPSNHSSMGTPAHLFSWDDLRGLLERHDCDVVVASAANFLSIGNDEICERWLHDEAMWDRFLGWEITSCAQPGAIDAGTHIIAVIRARRLRREAWRLSSPDGSSRHDHPRRRHRAGGRGCHEARPRRRPR